MQTGETRERYERDREASRSNRKVTYTETQPECGINERCGVQRGAKAEGDEGGGGLAGIF